MDSLMTERLVLRPLKGSDSKDMYQYAQKPTIGPNAGWAPHRSEYESYQIIQMMIRDRDVWAVTIKPIDKIVGTIGLHERDFLHAMENKKEIGYTLDDVYWGLGYMTEAVKKVIEYGFQKEKLTKITVGHALDNLRSKRVIEKCGFKFSHVEIRKDYIHNDCDVYMYEMTKEQYDQEKNK